MLTRCSSSTSSGEVRKCYRNKGNKFRGLSKEGSYVPPNPDMIKDGRSNAKFIRFLYMAENPITAVFDVRLILFVQITWRELR